MTDTTHLGERTEGGKPYSTFTAFSDAVVVLRSFNVNDHRVIARFSPH